MVIGDRRESMDRDESQEVRLGHPNIKRNHLKRLRRDRGGRRRVRVRNKGGLGSRSQVKKNQVKERGVIIFINNLIGRAEWAELAIGFGNTEVISDFEGEVLRVVVRANPD